MSRNPASTLKFHEPFPEAQARTIRLALERGLISDKAQARVEGVSPRSINDRWAAIADRLQLQHGQRDRAVVVVTLVRSRSVEFLMLALGFYLGALPLNTDAVRTPRTLRGAGSVATARREGGAPSLALDLDTGSLTWSWV